MNAALSLMYVLVLEDGKRWGEVAADFQIADAEAVLADVGPHSHFLTRPRGGSKTTDTAAIVLSWLATDAPRGARGYVVASSSEQAAILVDAARGFVDRTPELHGIIEAENEKLVNPATGAWVKVQPADGSSAWGLRGALFLVADEFGQWPDGRNARKVWEALLSTRQKTPGCRLLILTSAGEPSHFSYAVLEEARRERQAAVWRVSETPGPLPWTDPADLESQRYMLSPSAFARLHLNAWTELEDSFLSPEDISAATVLDGPIEPKSGTKYLLTVDVGVKFDSTVVCVSHAEPVSDAPNAPRRVVVDRLRRWTGTKRAQVKLDEVEAFVAWAANSYNHAEAHFDPSQALGMMQRLTGQGVRCQEFPFTATSTGAIGSALAQAFRLRQVHIPEDHDLVDELHRVKMVENSHGVRIGTERQGHDDQAVVLAMTCHLHLAKPTTGAGSMWLTYFKRQLAKDAEALPTPADARRQSSPFGGMMSQLQGTDAPAVTPGNRCHDLRWNRSDGRCMSCGSDDFDSHPARTRRAS